MLLHKFKKFPLLTSVKYVGIVYPNFSANKDSVYLYSMQGRKLLIVLQLIALSSFAQNFELEQVEQIWRPRIKTDFRYVNNSNYADTSSHLSYTEQNCVVTFPIKTKLSANLKLDLSSLKLKEILKNSVSVNASQIMGSVRIGAKQVHIGLDSTNTRNLYNANAGIFGLKLTKKYRILFYALNAGFYEQDKSIDKLAIRGNGIIGQFHIRGLRKNYYYGLITSYTNGLFIPLPFFGGMEPIGSKFTFYYTLPAQVSLQYKINNKNFLTSGFTIDGYRYGMMYNKERINFNYGSLAFFTNYKVKLTKSFGLKINGGYNLVQYIKLNGSDLQRTNYQLKPGFFAEIGIYTLFGKTLFEQVMGSINENVL